MLRVPLTFVGVNGQRWSVSADVGDTLLQTADKHDIPLFAECGGGGVPRDKYGEGPMCRSCHVFIDNAHTQRALPLEQDEDDILQWVDTRTKKSEQTGRSDQTWPAPCAAAELLSLSRSSPLPLCAALQLSARV